MASVVHRNRLVVFGGVADTETENDIVGEFFSSLHAFDMDRYRWYELSLRGTESGGGKKSRRGKRRLESASQTTGDASTLNGDSGDDDGQGEEEEEEEDESAAAAFGLKDDAFYVIMDGKFVKVEDEDEDEGLGSEAAPAPSAAGPKPTLQEVVDKAASLSLHPPPPPPAVAAGSAAAATAQQAASTISAPASAASLPWGGQPAPLPRMTAALSMLGNRLFVFGGTREVGDVQVTYDDVWALDLTKMDAWAEIERGTWLGQAWAAKAEDESEDSSSEEDDDEDQEDELRGDGVEGDADELDEDEEDARNVREMSEQIKLLRDELRVDQDEFTPKAGEELRAFFARTCDYWLEQLAKVRAAQALKWGEQPERLSGKELRGEAFKLAKTRFDLLHPLLEQLNALEEEQHLAEEAAAEEARALAARAAQRLKQKSGAHLKKG
jgi:hypothetical protein